MPLLRECQLTVCQSPAIPCHPSHKSILEKRWRREWDAGEYVMFVLEFFIFIKHTAVCNGTAMCITICCSLRGSPLRDTQRKQKWFYDPYLCNYQCKLGYFLDEISVSLDCCITGLWQPIMSLICSVMKFQHYHQLQTIPPASALLSCTCN